MAPSPIGKIGVEKTGRQSVTVFTCNDGCAKIYDDNVAFTELQRQAESILVREGGERYIDEANSLTGFVTMRKSPEKLP